MNRIRSHISQKDWVAIHALIRSPDRTYAASGEINGIRVSRTIDPETFQYLIECEGFGFSMFGDFQASEDDFPIYLWGDVGAFHRFRSVLAMYHEPD